MRQFVPVIQVVVGVLLSVCVLLQAKGTGLGHSASGMAYHARRGMEQLLFKATIVLAVIFVLASIANQFLP